MVSSAVLPILAPSVLACGTTPASTVMPVMPVPPPLRSLSGPTWVVLAETAGQVFLTSASINSTELNACSAVESPTDSTSSFAWRERADSAMISSEVSLPKDGATLNLSALPPLSPYLLLLSSQFCWPSSSTK